MSLFNPREWQDIISIILIVAFIWGCWGIMVVMWEHAEEIKRERAYLERLAASRKARQEKASEIAAADKAQKEKDWL